MFKNKGLVGKMLRLPLKAIPDGMVLPILSGELRGAKWIAGSSTNGCWLGIYERAVQVLLGLHLQSGAVFYDIGANVGFFRCLPRGWWGVEAVSRHLNRCHGISVI